MSETNASSILYQKESTNANVNSISAEKENQEILKILIHDIKNPMSSLIGYLGLISMMSRSFEDKPKQYITNSIWSSQEMAVLCKNIEDSVNIETNSFPLRLEKLELENILKKNIEKLTPIAEYFQKKIVYEIFGSMRAINADKNLIDRMLYTLINHSLQHCPNGKEIKIRLKEQEKFLLLEIEDEGAPILEEHLEKYFDKFFSIHSGKGVRRPKGWDGYFCKLVMNLHGGKIHLQRVENRQIFSIFFP